MTSEINITSIGLLFLFLCLKVINAVVGAVANINTTSQQNIYNNAIKNTCMDSRATCINIRRCPYIIEIAREQRGPLPPETVETIRKLRCGTEGNDPMVCCILQAEDIPNPPNVTNHPNLRLLDHQACGPYVPQNFLGTLRTRIFDYPWMVLLAYNSTIFSDGEKPEFLCGGSIISSRYILTTAHCIAARFPLVSVRVGARNMYKKRDCDTDSDGHEIQCSELYQDFDIESTHPHPDYNRKNYHNDIGLIRLNGTIDFTPFSVKPICLPFGSATILNQRTAIVTGWGRKKDAFSYDGISPNLLQVRLPLVSNKKCNDFYEEFNSIEIWYKHICAGGLKLDSCKGDSGGPLQAPGIYNGAVRTVQYGIVSFGLACYTPIPGVYTKVSYYMDWILDTMKD